VFDEHPRLDALKKGIVEVKILSPSLAATFLMIWHGPAFPFDYQRFSTETTHSEGAGAYTAYGGEVRQRDTFELAPSGKVDKIPVAIDLNTNVPDITQIDSPRKEISSRQLNENLIGELNTSYSSSVPRTGANGECGPSTMTAAEIEDLVGRTAQTYGVDPALAKAIAWTESRFDRNRSSRKGARGPMQLMPATATGLGVNEICDPVSNIDGGIRHLKLMLDEFPNPLLAVAAYNAGAQAVYDNGGVPPFAETVRYVAAVINHQMGLQLPSRPSTRGNASASGSPSASEMASDVLGARGSRFVKGVMQF
jgi:hypothetical protein